MQIDPDIIEMDLRQKRAFRRMAEVCGTLACGGNPDDDPLLGFWRRSAVWHDIEIANHKFMVRADFDGALQWRGRTFRHRTTIAIWGTDWSGAMEWFGREEDMMTMFKGDRCAFEREAVLILLHGS